jgi:hypothetical protein
MLVSHITECYPGPECLRKNLAIQTFGSSFYDSL